MSAVSVNDHLEGILSDFEALKRSFDIEDVDDIPSFSSASTASSPVSPSPSHFFHSHNKTSDVRVVGQSPSSSFNNINALGSAGYQNRVSRSSNPSPVLRSRTLVSSLSFNRGTTNKPAIYNNSSVNRAASFQSRVNPNSGFSILRGPGSDNDSLHSSTSSLEYSGVGGGSLQSSKLISYPNSPPQGEHPQTQPQFSPQKLQIGENLKFSSPGTALDQGIGLVLGAPDSHGINHGSMSSLDIQICDGGGGVIGVQRGPIPSGSRYNYANASWNGRLQNATSPEVEGNYGPNHHHYSGPQTTQPKAKDTPRLGKFPLDLESLVAKIDQQPVSPNPPKPPPRSTGSLQHHVATSSPSAPRSPTQTTPLGTLCKPQFAQVNPSSSPSDRRAARHLEDHAGDSVGSILQRIASFSRPVMADTSPGPVPVIQPPVVPKNGALSPQVNRPTEVAPMATRGNDNMRNKESAAEEPSLMEEREEKENGIVEEDQVTEDKSQAILANDVTQNTEKEPKANGLEVHPELEEKEKEKGMEEGEMKKELESEVKEQVCQSVPLVPDLQMSFIHGSDLFGYVGIEAVLDQMRHKTMKAGFEFNIMVVGQSGLGKSTMVNTLFKSKVSRKSCTPNYEEKISQTVELQTMSHMIEEKGVKMKLTVIDTPGFGDQINNENCWEPIVEYINEQYEKYLREELHVNRKRRIPDTRVHCCVYFLAATGHRLRPIDVEFMKRLGKIVSIVPVIAKADTLTIEERQEFKERIRQDLAGNGIRVYPQKEYDEDAEESFLNDRIRESIPFAVVGTDKEHQVNGNKVLGRKTKWGIIEVENVAHCEFANLRDLLIRSHLQDLKDVTHNIHYETYRVRRLNESNMNFIEQGLSSWPLENGTVDKFESDSHL
ncbi:uncharacterized protein septin12 isoform X1 [Stigmatopora nigra]